MVFDTANIPPFAETHHHPDTYEWYRYRLERFVQKYPDLRTHELRPFHVQQWLDGMMELSSGSRHNYCRAIKRAARWAKQQGYVDRNPIAEMEQPKAGKREVVISQDELFDFWRLCPAETFGFGDGDLGDWVSPTGVASRGGPACGPECKPLGIS